MARTVMGRRLLPVILAFWLMAWTAATATPVAHAATEQGGSPQADVVLLLDRSGSMAKNDPTDLSATGARVFMGMLDPGDRVAVVTFDSTARTLLPMTPVGDGAPARTALATLGRPVGEWTDIKAALQTAMNLLGQPRADDRQAAVLLFTDGKPETQPDGVPQGYMEEMAQIVSRMAGRAVPVFTVGLGQADFNTLGQIAAGTRAESFAATSDAQVVKLFADVLSRIKERHVVLSFTEDLTAGAAGQSHAFHVPPYTRLLTLSGVGGSGKVGLRGQSPGGGALDSAPGLKVATGANYTVYTIPNPAPGTWTVQLEGTGRVEAHGQTESALRLSLVNPKPYSQVGRGQPVAVETAVTGDPDPQTPLDVWAQAGAAAPVKLNAIAPGRYHGTLQMDDGSLTLWATRAGGEVARKEFRLYPVATSPARADPAAGPAPPLWRKVAPAAAAATGGVGALLLTGALNWRRLRRREELLTGRLGTHTLHGRGRRLPIGDLATLEAELIPLGWSPLTGLYLTRRELRIYIRQNAGIRCQINGRPPGDGRLYHGDEVTLGGETYPFHNPRLARRPASHPSRPRRPHIQTLKG